MRSRRASASSEAAAIHLSIVIVLCTFISNTALGGHSILKERARPSRIMAGAPGVAETISCKLHVYCSRCIEWLLSNPGASLLYAIPFIFISLCARKYLLKTSRHVSQPKSNFSDLERRNPSSSLQKHKVLSKGLERKAGIWTPIDFKRPAASPYPAWNVHTTKPIPYRPFKWGPYYITMGLRSMKWDDWIELDNQFLSYHADKARRIAERGPKCNRTAAEAFDGACELLEELCDYLPQRYPSLYHKTAVGMNNLLTGESFNVVERPLAEDPMQMAGRMVQDDLAIMFEQPDGQYYFLAGSILLAGFWRLEDKFAMPLSEIHTSGNVPGFKTKLEKGMNNFFRRVQPNAPVVRHNYFFQMDDHLPWSTTIGSEDDFGSGEKTVKTAWTKAEKNKPIEHCHFRSERQTLRRLPRSGGVVFTIRTYFHPITEIAEEPGVPGRLASAIRSWGDDVSIYKGKAMYSDVLLEFLDIKHKEQVDKGLVAGDEEMESVYPY